MHQLFDNSTTKCYSDDRRKGVRYLIRGTVWFEWLAADGQLHEAFGLSREIGKDGAFVESESAPPLGTPVKLAVTLPTSWRPDVNLHLHGAGDVRHIRVDRGRTSGYGARVAFQTGMPMSSGEMQEKK